MTELQKNIQLTIEELTISKKAVERKEFLTTEINEQNKQIDSLHSKLSKELKDFEQIQKLGVKSMFHKILGNKEQQIEKERHEYLEASYAYNEGVKSLELLEFEYKLINPKTNAFKSLNENLEKLKTERESEILRTNPKLADQLLKISQNLDQHYHLQSEYIEAINQGNTCLKQFETLINLLRRVQNWGHYPRGKNFAQKMALDNYINRAKSTSIVLKHALHKYNNELKDIGFQSHFLNYKLNEFTDFGSIFFGNLITDWIFQNKLRNSISHSKSMYDRVHLIQKSVEKSHRGIQRNIKDLTDHRNSILLK